MTNHLGVNSLAFSNGTIALILALRGLNLSGEIIVPSFTFAASVHAIKWAGCTPVFVDIDEETFNIDPHKVTNAITSETSAILAVHVFGNPCDITELQKVANEHNLKLVFDAAHAFGSNYQGYPIGQFGDVEMFSTHATKTLITAEGGVLSTRNNQLLEYLKRARNFGFSDDNEDTLMDGTNAKMSELHALVGLDSLAHVNDSFEKKQAIVAHYRNALKNIRGITLQKVHAGNTSAYLFFSILVGSNFPLTRDQLFEELAANDIQTRKYFFPPVHKHSSYQEFNHPELPVTERVSSQILCLPSHTNMSSEDVEKVCEVITEVSESFP
ncbi:TPA: DegT/DnrJ/EryC1/StrS family aminotransferase [Candidatus Woesearchaeota archaeon]|nr:DegT/DnrJ/EryC1/StrS family aminotransferase [Candidatus Woesearchaeota archaeon]